MKRPFEQIVTEHGPTVLRVCRALLARTDADDAWSETFLAALRAYDRLPPDSHPRAWVLKIAERKALDAHRARARRAIPTDDAPDTGISANGPAEPALWAAVRALPPKQRAAVVHRFVADLPYAGVAEAIGCSEEAARQNVRAGLASLRKEWAP